jgi:hypothetical protein
MGRSGRTRAALVLLALAALAGCGDSERLPATQTPARPSRATLRLVVVTDPSGYLAPCGCQSRPLGGIDRAAAALRELRADGTPTLLLAAGNLFFSPGAHEEPVLDGAQEEAARQARWQAEALAGIFGELGLAAATPGPADVQHGAEALRELAARTRAPLLGLARAGDAGATPAAGEADSLLLERGGVRVGIWGLSDLPGGAGSTASADLASRAQALTASLRARGAALVVGLVQSDARLARKIAAASQGLDVLVLGGLDSADAPPPERIGAATLVRAARHGHGLLVLDLHRTGDGAFTDVSAWTRQAQRDAIARSVEELAARVAEWRRDPAVDRKLLAEQEARLTRLHAELRGLDQPARASGNTLSARFIELDPDAPSDTATRALMDAHDLRVNEHNRVALAAIRPKPVPEGEPGYAGSERCGSCHGPAFAWWRGHAHGRAYATLVDRHKQFNLSCVGCHVTGYNQPGGATVVHNEGLTDVGCESCHGPGSLHVEDQDVAPDKNVTRTVAEAVCKHCHNPEHSDRFTYDAYRAMLIAPGHGLPAGAAR